MVYWEKQKKIKALYELSLKPLREKYGLTQMEYSVLMFLYRNPDHDTATSIVQTGQFTKSHVSSAIKALEQRNLVAGEYRYNNNKTIHLKLTDRAREILKELQTAGERYSDCLFAGFSDDELSQVRGYFKRICSNAEAELQILEEGRKDA